MNVFDAPIVLDKFNGQPIEQLWVCGRLALDPEVIRSAYDSPTEVMMPKSIDDHASGQRVMSRRQPLCQRRASAGRRLD